MSERARILHSLLMRLVFISVECVYNCMQNPAFLKKFVLSHEKSQKEQTTTVKTKSKVVNHLLVLSRSNDCWKYIHFKLILVYGKPTIKGVALIATATRKHQLKNIQFVTLDRTRQMDDVRSVQLSDRRPPVFTYHSMYPRLCTYSSSSPGKHKILCCIEYTSVH